VSKVQKVKGGLYRNNHQNEQTQKQNKIRTAKSAD
jgi:hypothetical protein